MLLCFPLELEWINKYTSESQMSQQEVSVTTTVTRLACEQAFRGTLAVGGGGRKESLQLHLWNVNSNSNSPVAPC